MAYDTTFPSGENYKKGASIMVVGGTLVFDTTTATVLTVSGGQLVATAIPTVDPEITGALWSDSGVLKLSIDV